MSCIVKIKENYINYSPREKRIADYILENLGLVINQSAQMLSYETRTSPATIVRFAKKIGYEGFSTLKMEIAKEYQTYQSTLITDSIASEDTIEVLVGKAELANASTFDKTYRLIDYPALEASIQALTHARRIFLFGVGGAGIACDDLYHKLIRINKDVTFVSDFHLLLTSLAHASSDDVTVAMSYSGETQEIIKAQAFAHAKGAATIAITSSRRSELVKYSDHVHTIPKEEARLKLGSISSRYAFLILSDLLYFGIAKEAMQATDAALKRTHDVFTYFRDESDSNGQ